MLPQKKPKPATPSKTTDSRGRMGRSESAPRVPRPGEISQASASSDREPSQQPGRRLPQTGQQAGARRPPARGNVQTAMPAARIREVSVYSDAAGPPPTPTRRRPERVDWGRPARGAVRSRPPMRPREISEVSMYADAVGPPLGSIGRGRGRGRQESRDGLRPQAKGNIQPQRPRPWEISNVSGVPYPQPVKSSQFPPARRPRETSRVQAADEYEQLFSGPWEISQPSVYRSGNRGARLGRTAPRDLWEQSYSPEGETTPVKPQSLDPFRVKELPITTALLIQLLWLPRFFIPWITAWYDFSIYVLSNPTHLKERSNDLFHAKLTVLLCKSIMALISSFLVDCIRRKCDQKYYIYLALLALFSLSPLAGGFATVALKARFLQEQMYYDDYWFTSIVLMEWAISFSFIMFPVQLVCIYTQNSKMSRNAHYFWTSLFVLLEFINAYIAFVAIPTRCPTTHGAQLVVWNIIGPLLVMVVVVTVFSFFTTDVVKGAMLMCRNNSMGNDQNVSSDPFLAAPADVTKKKLGCFVLLAIPVVSTYFSFAVLERFVPYDDWNDHPSSALGLFVAAKLVGVVVMVSVMFGVRRAFKGKPSSIKAEMIYLGLPHVLLILALLTMVGRLASLSHPHKGDIIVGPIPDNDKTVFVFINTMFRNRTVCITSNYFKPFRIRPHQLVTREVYDELKSMTITFEVDPCSSPGIRPSSVFVEDVSKGDWKVYNVALLSTNTLGLDKLEYYSNVYAYTLTDEGTIRPKVGSSYLLIFPVIALDPAQSWFYQLNHSGYGTVNVHTNNSGRSTFALDRTAKLFDVPVPGKWTVQLWSSLYTRTDKAYAWATNCIQCVVPREFEIENNSLYLLVEYFYEEAFQLVINYSLFDNPPKERFQGFPLSYDLFKLAELAGPNSDRIPSTNQLQKDWAVGISMALAGIAAGGIFVGFIYIFWVDPPMPRYRTITLAVVWVLMGVAAGIPRIVLIKVDIAVSAALLILQIVMTVLHLIGSYFMFVSTFDFHKGP